MNKNDTIRIYPKTVVLAMAIAVAILQETYHAITFLDRQILTFFIGYTVLLVVAREDSRLTFVSALLLFLGMFISFMVVGPIYTTERLATWTVLFFLYGLAEQAIERR